MRLMMPGMAGYKEINSTIGDNNIIMPGMSPSLFNTFIDDEKGWKLIFENEDDKQTFNIRISEQKLIKEAISWYYLKSGRMDKCKFIFNNSELFPEMKICQSGLTNMSKILVVTVNSKPVTKNISSNNSLNPIFTDFNPAYYESQINNLKEQLNIEKNKNSILMNENAKFQAIINNLNANQVILNNSINLLKNELNKKNMEIQNYLNNINNHTINDLVTSINPGEKIITVNFVSQGFQDIANYSIPCKNTNLFIRLEEKLNNDFPQLKNHETFFVVNTRRIKRFQTLEENKIKSNDIIHIFSIDD